MCGSMVVTESRLRLRLFCLDIAFADHLSPCRDIGTYRLSKLVRGARLHVRQTQRLPALGVVGRLHGAVDCGVKALDDGARCPGRSDQAVPGRDLEINALLR